MASWFSKWRFGKGRRTWGRSQTPKQSVFLRIQVRASSQTKGLERGWKRRVRLGRDAINTLTPLFTNFFTDFEKKLPFWSFFCKTPCFAVQDEVGYLSNSCWATELYDHAQNKRICVLASQRQTQRKELRDRWAWWRKTELSNHHILNFSLRLQINCRIHICIFCAWSWKLFPIEWMISQQKPRLWTDVATIMAIWSFFLFLLLSLFRSTEESRSLSMAWAVECCVWLRN